MKRKLLIAYLVLIKRLLGTRLITMRIRGGPNLARIWKVSRHTNNEIILGDWEFTMQSILKKYVHVGDHVLDLGAHQGFLTMIISDLVGTTGWVFAAEALASNFRLLEIHLKANHIGNCVAKFGAVSSTTGTVKFTTSEADVSNTYIDSSPAFRHGAKFVETPAFALDDLLSSGIIKRPQFVKIDVEGAEYEVLCGAEKLLSSCSPVIYLETHDVHRPGVDQMCLEMLAKFNYKVIEFLGGPKEGLSAYVLIKDEGVEHGDSPDAGR